MSTSEPAVEREAGLEKLRRRMARAARRGDRVVLEQLAAEYGQLKAEHVTRARRAAERAERAAEGPQRWRLPVGFGVSPGAAERARQGRRREEPAKPARGASPWRGGWHPAQERVWRP
jgi:hypothetical protein